MRSVNLSVAYQLQKKCTRTQNIRAYKVGASNFRSAAFFGCDDILLGGIDSERVFDGEVTRDYPVAELEVVTRIMLGKDDRQTFSVLEHYIGLECPDITVDNPEGSPFICVADNCAAGDLIIYDRVQPDQLSEVTVCKHDRPFQSGSLANLRYDLTDILRMTVQLIDRFQLPHETNELLIATGGITDVFSVDKGDRFEFVYR